MRKLALIIACLFVGGPLVLAGEEPSQHHNQTHKGHAHDSKAAESGEHAGHDGHGHAATKPEPGAIRQKSCPVSGKPIQTDKSIMHEGQKIYFCSATCIDKFKKSPNHYLPALYRQIHPQRLQVRCPVMGGKVNLEVFTEYKGRRVYYCCPGCDEKFKADPAKYLAKLRDLSTDQVHCPITGDAIDSRQSVEHGGKTVYFCCEDCVASFKAHPERSAGALQPEAGLLARGPTAKQDLLLCPVCVPEGGIHKRSDVQMITHDGLGYAMCNSSCTKTFKASPDKYIKVLAAKVKQHLGKTGPTYACPMHPSVVQVGSGKCPVCGMNLKAASSGK